MHARCDTDPLDSATDLCDHCGGEYCDDHLVRPYGPKRPPLCRSCAIALSGVRSSGAPARKRSRSQIKRRRAELREQRAQGPADPGFEPSDDPSDLARAPIEPGHATAAHAPLAAARPRRGRRFGLGRSRSQGPDGTGAAAEGTGAGSDNGRAERAEERPDPRVAPGPTPAPSSATLLLARLREVGAVPAASSPVANEADQARPAPVRDVWTDPPEVSARHVADEPAPLPPRRADADRPPPHRRPAPPGPLPRRRVGGVPGAPTATAGAASPHDRPPRPVPPAPPGFSSWPGGHTRDVGAPAGGPAGDDLWPEADDPWADVPPALRGSGQPPPRC